MRDATVPMPGRYSAAIAVMQEMHWSWTDLCDAPFDLVEELAHRLHERAHWQGIRHKQDEARRKVATRKGR